MSHTPGPWTLQSSPYEDGKPYFIIEAGSAHWPKGFHTTSIMSEADARLIAAAPDLLAAAKIVLETLNIAIDEATKAGGLVPVFVGVASLHDAIAKAEPPALTSPKLEGSER